MGHDFHGFSETARGLMGGIGDGSGFIRIKMVRFKQMIDDEYVVNWLVDNLPAPPEIEQYTTKLADGWGAGMLYLILKDHEALPEQPHHYQCVAKDDSAA